MFDFDIFIHMDRIVLVRDAEIKTLDLVSTIQAARNFVIIYTVDYLQTDGCVHTVSTHVYNVMYSKSFLYQNSLN